MRNRLSLIPLLLALVVAFAGAPSAAQADFTGVFTDCNDGTIDGKFSAKDLQDAMKNLDAFTGDYSECSDAIVRAQQAQAGGTSNGSNGGSGSGASAGTSNTTPAPVVPAPATPSTSGSTSTGGTTTTDTSAADRARAEQRRNDARDADLAEKAAALAAATAFADKRAGDEAAKLKNIGVPVAALELGGSDTTLPTPLLLTLVACVLAACLVGASTGFQALRRRRGR